MNGEEFLHQVSVIKETADAILVKWGGPFNAPKWIPKSVIHDDSEVSVEGDEGTLVVKESWAANCEWWE